MAVAEPPRFGSGFRIGESIERNRLDSLIQMNSSRFKISGLTLTALIAVPVLADSARATYPELVGIRRVSLNISLSRLPGLESEAFEADVRRRLAAAGLLVREHVPSLYLHVSFREVPECADLILVRTELAISENVRARRPGKNHKVWVDTYSSEDDFIVARDDAWDTARESLLSMLDYLLDSREYTASLGRQRQ